MTLLSVRGGTIICAWWHCEGRSRCLSVLLSHRPGSNYVLSFFVPVDYESDGHKGERNNDGAGGVEKGPERLTLLSACCV